MSTDLVSAAAQNLADWHDACLHALGIGTSRSELMWRCTASAPFIYLTAITLEGSADAQRRDIEGSLGGEGQALAVCDSWGQLDLTDLGFQEFEDEAWYVRGPEPAGAALQDVERVTDATALAEFESANTDGFEVPELHELEPFGIYGEGLLADPRVHVFVHREAGQVVSGAMACVSSGVVGVYAVATVPAFRRRGFGEAVTWAAVAAAPSLPAVLQPSPEGARLYRRMGFVPVGRYTKWLRLP